MGASKIIASICFEGKIYLLCDTSQIMQWPTRKNAEKFFKRFYGAAYRAGDQGLKQFHLLADFKLHQVSDHLMTNGVFERAIVKRPADADIEFQAHEHPITPLVMYGVSMHALLCSGERAATWHKGGIQPPFPKFKTR